MKYKCTHSIIILFCIILVSLGGCADEKKINTYHQNGIRFIYPSKWKISMDSQLFDERTIALDTTTKSVVLVESYDKKIIGQDPMHKNILASLTQFANYFDKRDIAAKLQTAQPAFLSSIKRDGYSGLKEVQKFIVSNIINDIAVREFYRMENVNRIIFITMDTSVKEYDKTAIGLGLILKTLKISNT